MFSDTENNLANLKTFLIFISDSEFDQILYWWLHVCLHVTFVSIVDHVCRSHTRERHDTDLEKKKEEENVGYCCTALVIQLSGGSSG